MLRKARTATPYTLTKYRAPAKRAYKINKKFSKQVAESQGWTYRFTDIDNNENQGLPGVASWTEIIVGSPDQLQTLYEGVHKTAQGANTAEFNTSVNNFNTWKMHVKIMKMIRHTTWINNGTSSVNVSVYELVPRRDLHANATIAAYAPKSLLENFTHSGDYLESGKTAMSSTDHRMTPFMVPLVVQNWKIINTRNFKVHAGGTFTTLVANNNKMFIPGVDGEIVEMQYKKGHAKVLLVKIVGELGVVVDGAGVAKIRNLPHNVIYKTEDNWVAHLSENTRSVYWDNNETYNTGTFTGTTVHINKETGAPVTYQQIEPTAFT